MRLPFFRIDGEGAGGWGANEGKMTIGSGGCRAGVSAVARDRATCGAFSSREK